MSGSADYTAAAGRRHRARGLVRLAPGLILCLAMAGVAQGLAAWPAIHRVVPLSALSVAILLGVLVRLCLSLPAAVEPGIRWTLHWLLRAGIVLLGFRLGFPDLLSIGPAGLALIGVGVGSTIALSIGLGRLLGLPDTLSTLIGGGTGICGASAVVAVDGVIRGREQDVACAIAVVTVFGTIAMFGYPVLAHGLNLAEPVYAAWAGGSIHEVAQAVAAGFAFGEQAGVDTSLYKLGRVALLAPACAVLALWWRRRAQGGATSSRRTPFPVFVLLFVAVVGLNSMISLPGPIHAGLQTLDTGLLATAMAAMGLSTRLQAVIGLGWRPLFLGLVAAAWLSVLMLGGALWLVGAGTL
ncbi:YeiH family protein [Salinisphaera sp. Q1T1-3]|uniref:YeiH family protein n=1 Tax=Salinisphaera sp. Q1T1-3 TaxID=2321229 RepID=UPI000E74995D|nr:putative sulfate exporter family transporter [Salinisphaera sp. Q1T1-3]RJS92001.1 putative sulfate exporter family transporter [Salinisphaera sp. Q1T1-3]